MPLLVTALCWPVFLSACYLQSLVATTCCWHLLLQDILSLVMHPFILFGVWMVTVFWDTRCLYISPTPRPSRRIRCHTLQHLRLKNLSY